MNKEFGETHLRGFMVKVLNDLIDFFNVGKSIGAVQVAQTVDLIIDEYYFFKPDDFKLCFNRAKKGLYGKVYDRIDGGKQLGCERDCDGDGNFSDDSDQDNCQRLPC